MFDILSRALRHPTDYAPILTRHTIALTAHFETAGNIHIFEFTPHKPLRWKSGQHGIFRFPNTPITGKSWRPFSIASSPHEGIVRIGTIIPDEPSDFKQHLRALAPDDELILHGPFGEFHTPNTPTHAIGIAGGIGITPFRALLYDIAHGYDQSSIHLIYSARDNTYTFRDDLAAFQSQTDAITVAYVDSKDATAAAIAAAFKVHGADTPAYISGSPGMIAATRQSLHAQGVTRIINDPFKGY